MTYSPMVRLSSLLLALLLVGAASVPGALRAEEKSAEVAALEQFFTAPVIEADWFAQMFLDQVPASQLLPARQQVTAGLGEFQRIEDDPSGEGFRAIYEKGYVPCTISLDGMGKINGLFLRPPVPQVSSLPDSAKDFAALSGELSLLVLRNGEELQALNADQPLAVGSTFKLSILAALAKAVDRGTHQWDSVYQLREIDRSLPPGTLRDWPAGAPLTLYALAARMISESDNTATDALLHALGRESVEAHAPERNRPFLGTREAFALKNPENEAVTERFLASSTPERRAILEGAAELMLPGEALFTAGTTVRPEIEWFYSARELCALMESVAGLEITQINDGGLASKAEWQTVSYKGGSEPGVLNQTFWLLAGNGDHYCLSATRNDDTPFDNNSLFLAVNGIARAIASATP